MAYMDHLTEHELEEFIKILEDTLPDDPRKKEFIDFMRRRMNIKDSIDRAYDDAMKGII
jgi:hypothetical protein